MLSGNGQEAPLEQSWGTCYTLAQHEHTQVVGQLGSVRSVQFDSVVHPTENFRTMHRHVNLGNLILRWSHGPRKISKITLIHCGHYVPYGTRKR